MYVIPCSPLLMIDLQDWRQRAKEVCTIRSGLDTGAVSNNRNRKLYPVCTDLSSLIEEGDVMMCACTRRYVDLPPFSQAD